MNNLAYFYEDEMSDIKKAKEFLEKTVALKSAYPNSFNAVELIYVREKNYENALKMFEKAKNLDLRKEYITNYLSTLYLLGKIDLQTLLESDIDFREETIADIDFLLGNYKGYIDFYKNNNYAFSKDWIEPYLYACFKLGLLKEMDEAFNYMKADLKLRIKEAIEDDEDWRDFEKQEYIDLLKKEIKELSQIYNAIKAKNYKPDLIFEPDFARGCYLIDCPRNT